MSVLKSESNTLQQFSCSLKKCGDTRFVVVLIIDQSDYSITISMNNNIQGENCLFNLLYFEFEIIKSHTIIVHNLSLQITHIVKDIQSKHVCVNKVIKVERSACQELKKTKCRIKTPNKKIEPILYSYTVTLSSYQQS